jgi:hypothetical protein
MLATQGALGLEVPEGEADVRVISATDHRVALQRREQVRGRPAPERLYSELAPGLYILHLRYTRIGAEAAVLFRAGERRP